MQKGKKGTERARERIKTKRVKERVRDKNREIERKS